jgi:hypothetical protein
MIPAQYSLQIYRGDSYYGALITLPDLSPFGGPSDLTGAVEVKAQMRAEGARGAFIGEFEVDYVDRAARKIRLQMEPSVTAEIDDSEAIWDLQVDDGVWVGTPLAGAVSITGEVTRDE